MLSLFSLCVFLWFCGNSLAVKTQFATKLFTEALKEFPEDNVIVSPSSLLETLYLLYLGSNDLTAQQIQHLLNLPSSKKKRKSERLTDIAFKLYSAERLYLSDKFRILKEFQELAKPNFRADVHNIDFSNTGSAISKINNWFANQTKNKITKFLNKGDLNYKTKLVAVSAVYFYGKRSETTDKDSGKNPLRPQDIFLMPKKRGKGEFKVVVDIIRAELYVRHSFVSGLDSDVLIVPYGKNKTISMVIIAPSAEDGIQSAEASLFDYDVRKLGDDFPKKPVQFSMPKLKLRFNIDLRNAFKLMGLKNLFDGADLTNMSSSKDLTLDAVFHKTMIEVDQQSVQPDENVTAFPSDEWLYIKIDHPFLFIIRDATKVHLIGRVVNMKSSKTFTDY